MAGETGTTNFPTGLDSYTDKVNNVSTVCATSVNNLQWAVEALQAKVGVDGSTNPGTLDYITSLFFSVNTRKLYFFQSTAPTGWSVAGLATNCVLGIKGGAQDWNNTGGTKQGDWTIDDQSEDSHWHYWMRTVSNLNYTYESDGDTLTRIYGNAYEVSGILGAIQKGNDVGVIGDWNTDSDSHSHTFNSTWRPQAALGILAKYVGP